MDDPGRDICPECREPECVCEDAEEASTEQISARNEPREWPPDPNQLPLF